MTVVRLKENRQVRTWLLYSVLTMVLVVMGVVLWDTRHDTDGTRQNLAIGCERANRTRAALHWLAENTIGIPVEILQGLNLTPREKPQADRPWLVDCDAAYPK